MKEKIIHTIFTRCMLVVATVALSACNDELNVRETSPAETFPFRVETILPKEVKQGKEAAIYFLISSKRNFSSIRYTISYRQHLGRGDLRFDNSRELLIHSQRYRIKKDLFKLYYTPGSNKWQMIEVIFDDNFCQWQSLFFNFKSNGEKVTGETGEIEQKYELTQVPSNVSSSRCK